MSSTRRCYNPVGCVTQPGKAPCCHPLVALFPAQKTKRLVNGMRYSISYKELTSVSPSLMTRTFSLFGRGFSRNPAMKPRISALSGRETRFALRNISCALCTCSFCQKKRGIRVKNEVIFNIMQSNLPKGKVLASVAPAGFVAAALPALSSAVAGLSAAVG